MGEIILMSEKWIRFYDYYELSNEGKIRSIDRLIERKTYTYQRPFKRMFKGKVLRLQKDRDGYYHTRLYNRFGEAKVFYLHRLLMKYYGPEKPKGHYVIEFRDGNRDNFSLRNLIWLPRYKLYQNRKDF